MLVHEAIRIDIAVFLRNCSDLSRICLSVIITLSDNIILIIAFLLDRVVEDVVRVLVVLVVAAEQSTVKVLVFSVSILDLRRASSKATQRSVVNEVRGN